MPENTLLIQQSDSDSLNTVVCNSRNNSMSSQSSDNQLFNSNQRLKKAVPRFPLFNLLLLLLVLNLILNVMLLFFIINVVHKIDAQNIDEFLDKLKHVVDFFCKSYSIC
tara:strand:- start:356 stop:682 length:327 start_codon:yes stop_codon:yes gene_type:complete